MTRKSSPSNLPASVRQRLANVSKQSGEEFGLLLTRYALERLLYRLSRSAHRDQFVLKGAMLFLVWSDVPHRPTHDLDLLGRGERSVARFVKVFREICSEAVEDDGMEYREESVRGGEIREGQEYGGLRITLLAMLGNARIPLQVDIGFGDAVTPGPVLMEYPAILGSPAPILHGYPREVVVAEKLEAMVSLGLTNTRMKDFYDLWVLARDFGFDGATLCDAISATFVRRGTALPEGVPVALTVDFHGDPTKQAQWAAFLRRGRLADGLGLGEVVAILRDFLLPPLDSLKTGQRFARAREAGSGWALPAD